MTFDDDDAVEDVPADYEEPPHWSTQVFWIVVTLSIAALVASVAVLVIYRMWFYALS